MINLQAKATSRKLDGYSIGWYRIQSKGIFMEKITIDYRVSEHLKRIADALEEILRLVKKDMQRNEIQE